MIVPFLLMKYLKLNEYRFHPNCLEKIDNVPLCVFEIYLLEILIRRMILDKYFWIIWKSFSEWEMLASLENQNIMIEKD